MKLLRNLLSVAGCAVLLAPSSSYACGVCMGQTDGSQVGTAVNGAIFVMLGMIGMMLAAIGGVAFSLWRHAKNQSSASIELAELLGNQSTSK